MAENGRCSKRKGKERKGTMVEDKNKNKKE
jgi:hypothetical protein